MGTLVLGSGLIVLDHIFLVKGTRIWRSNVKYLGSTGGGSMTNTLCMLALLGRNPVAFGVVGNDPSANIVRSDMSLFGVDSSHLVTRGLGKNIRQTRQFSHLIYDDGRHTFRKKCLDCGRSLPREVQLASGNLNRSLLQLAQKAKVLHVDRANKTTLRLASTCANSGGKISFDYGFESYGKGAENTTKMIKLSNLVKVEESLFRKRTGSKGYEGMRHWSERYPQTNVLLVTRGDRGLYGFANLKAGKADFDLPAVPCERYIDGGGAGDILVAMAIDSLLMGKVSSDKDELVKKLNVAQAMASLSCTLYGARGLQRALVNQKLSSSQIYDIGTKILESGKAGNTFPPEIGLPPPLSLPFRFASDDVCKVCGSISRTPRNKTKSESTLFVKELSRAPEAMIHGYEIGNTYRDSLGHLTERPALLVGSGGSLSAAVFGEQSFLRHLGHPAKALPPYEFEQLKRVDKSSGVWFISYGGGNSDILGAAEKARELKLQNCVVVTGTRTSPLARIANDNRWPVVHLEWKERGFVATVGMLATVSALAGIFTPKENSKDLDDFHEYNNLIKVFSSGDRIARDKVREFPRHIESNHIIGLASGWGWPALVDFESKVVEGGICTIEIAELKNYTHGRYISAFHHRPRGHFLMLRTPLEKDLVEFFRKKLSRYFNMTVIATFLPGIVGSLELLVDELFLASYLGKKVGRDIAKPKYPKEARGLYSWEPPFRKKPS